MNFSYFVGALQFHVFNGSSTTYLSAFNSSA